MNNNCTCSQTRDKFVIVFQELEPHRWQLIEAYGWVSKEHVPSHEDNLIQLSGETLRYGLSVSADYTGCPYCKANSIFVCGQCHTVNCCDAAAVGVLECAACGTGGRLTNS